MKLINRISHRQVYSSNQTNSLERENNYQTFTKNIKLHIDRAAKNLQSDNIGEGALAIKQVNRAFVELNDFVNKRENKAIITPAKKEEIQKLEGQMYQLSQLLDVLKQKQAIRQSRLRKEPANKEPLPIPVVIILNSNPEPERPPAINPNYKPVIHPSAPDEFLLFGTESGKLNQASPKKTVKTLPASNIPRVGIPLT